MATLNLDFGYFRNPKTKRLIGILGKSYADVPLRLWCHTGEFFVMDGILKGYSVQAVEDVLEYQGEPGKCVSALIEAGFLEKVPDGYYVSGWNEEQKHLAAYKIKSIRMNNARLQKLQEGHVDNLLSTAISESDHSSTSSSSSSSSRDPSDTLHVVPMQGNAQQVKADQYHALQSSKNAVSTGGNDSSNHAFIDFQLSDEEFLKWSSKIQKKINQENMGRQGNHFVWKPADGKQQIDEWRTLFKIFDEATKKKLLLEAFNILHGQLSWSKYVEMGIMMVVRLSNKKPINSAIGFTHHFLSKPAEIVSECHDGLLKELYGKVVSR